MPNLFHAAIPARGLANVQHLNAIEAALASCLFFRAPSECRTVLRMAGKTLTFVPKNTDSANTTPLLWRPGPGGAGPLSPPGPAASPRHRPRP